MNFSTKGLKRAGAGVQVLLMVGVVGTAGCKEDLDEARSALAATTKDRDALSVRVAALEHELATTQAELARLKASTHPDAAARSTVTSRGVTASSPLTAVPSAGGRAAAADRRAGVDAPPPTPISMKERDRPKS